MFYVETISWFNAILTKILRIKYIFQIMTEESIFNILLEKGSYNRNTDDDEINSLLVPAKASIIASVLAQDIIKIGSNPTYPPHHLKNNLVCEIFLIPSI